LLPPSGPSLGRGGSILQKITFLYLEAKNMPNEQKLNKHEKSMG
jgi:hypothetical protein